MCTRVTCRECGKPSWVGCGLHIEDVLGDVPVAQRCRCREERAARKESARGNRRWWKLW